MVKGAYFVTSLVTYEEKDFVGLITLNRPEAANAMSLKLLDDLNEIVKKIEHSDVRSVIITGSGEKAFCAGADLKERRQMTNEEVVKTVKYIGQTVQNIENIPVPVIAALNGVAFGGGLELALACDLRIAAEDIKLGLTETSLAIIPGAGGTQRLPRLIGLGQAKRLIYTACPIDAKEALQIGLVEEIVHKDELLPKAFELAKQIAKNGPIAMKQAKIAINRGIEVDLHTGLEIEHLSYLQTIETEDRVEGLQAFAEKRAPQYKGK